MIYIFLLSYIICTYLTYRIVRATLPFFYLLFFGVMYIGTTYGLNIDYESDVYYFFLIITFLFCYTIATVLFNIKFPISKAFKVYKSKPFIYDSNSTIRLFWFLLIISSILTVFYFYLVGSNIFIMIMNDSSQADITTARVNSYSGETYFAPGYFNQFKNVLFPVSICILLFNNVKNKKIIKFFFIPLAFLGLAGTGQRAFLMYTFLGIVISFFYIGKLKFKSLIIPSALMILSFGVGSFYLGRTQDLSFFATFDNLLTRIFYNEQSESLITFRYLYEIPISYGYDWYRGIIGILPGVKGSEIQHIVFGLIHGNPRGTAALSFIGSIYHNFGFVGVVIVSFIFGFLVNKLTFNFLKRKKEIGIVVFFSFITFYISIYSSGDVVFLFNKGVVLLMLLTVLIYNNRVWKR
ncbi:O-antigen polymerase [Xanthomarina gelatinilytica]|uniref:O-antigen polymerase n=1 Tax=Xanthomarina gelatinilytica TaxID=1137281 RepID=UPI003AA995F7